MLELTFWKVSLKGRAFTFIRVPPVAVMVMAIITEGVMVMVVAVVAAVVVMAPGKGFGKNPEKSSSQKKGGLPSGLPIQKGAQVGVTGAPLDISPRLKKTTKYKTRGGLPITKKRESRTDREKGRLKEKRSAGGIIYYKITNYF